jgi:hypothetical protein
MRGADAVRCVHAGPSVSRGGSGGPTPSRPGERFGRYKSVNLKLT